MRYWTAIMDLHNKLHDTATSREQLQSTPPVLVCVRLNHGWPVKTVRFLPSNMYTVSSWFTAAVSDTQHAFQRHWISGVEEEERWHKRIFFFQGCFNFIQMDVGRLKSLPKFFKFSLLLFSADLLFCFALFCFYNIDKRCWGDIGVRTE